MRRLRPTAQPVDALLGIALVAGIAGLGYALGVGWAGLAGPVVIVAGVIIGRMRHHA
jgi:hypothetical protein